MSNSINKVIEQVAYKQVEDMIVYLEMLDEQFLKTSKTARETSKSFSMPSGNNSELNKKLLESQTIIKQLQKDYKNSQDAIDKLTKKVDAYTKATERNNTEKKKLSERDRQYVIDAREITKIQDNEARVLSGLTTYLQKLIAVRGQYAQTIETYNAKMAMGVKLSNDEQFELYQSVEAHKKYDNAIKAANASTGKAHEYIGQYERANRGLNNSIAQIARELPSATFGFQTFALGISNNVPIAVDAIKEATEANKELIAQGKPTTSVWKQVVGAIFSFNTIMSVALLALALFGKEISDAASSLFGMKKSIDTNKIALEEHLKSIEKFNEKSAEMAAAEISNAKKLLFTAQNKRATDKERLKAVDELQRRYPSYLGNLRQEDILTGNIKDSELKLINALRFRAIAMASQDLLTENLKKQIKAELDYSRVLSKTNEEQGLYNLQQEKNTKDKIQYRLQTDEEAESLENLKKKQEQSIETVTRYGKAYKVQTLSNDNIRTNSLIPLKEEEKILETILNKYAQFLGVVNEDTEKKDKNTKAIKLNNKAREDYLASEYELWKLRKTNDTNLNKEIMEDEASSYDLRLLASEQYHNGMIELAQREAQEQQRVLKYTLDQRNDTLDTERQNEIAQLNAQLKNQQISQNDYYVKLKDIDDNYYYDKNGIQKNYENESLMISENYAQSYLNIQKEMIGKMIELYDTINFKKAEVEIAQVDLKGVEKLKEILGSIGSDMSIEEIQGKLNEVNNIANDYSIDIAKREASLELQRTENNKKRLEEEIILNGKLNNLSDFEIANQINSNQALLDLDKQIIESKKKVTETDNEETKKQIENKLLVLQKERELNEQLFQMKVELASSISELANQLFSNEIERYDREIEKSNEHYDSLLENAEKGSEQEKLIQEEKQRAEDEIQRKKIESQRKQAVFNKMIAIAEIGIELAKTIAKINMTAQILTAMSAINPLLAALIPLTYSQIPLAIATSAIQVGTVLATPLPQYKDGTDFHKGGKAVLGDGYVSEVVENPDGSLFLTPNKPTILDLPKGAKVHSSLDEFNKNKLNLESASIMASFVNQSNQLKAFDYYLGKELNGLSDKIEKGIEKGFKKAKINNNNVNNVYIGRKPSNFFN